MSWKSHNGERKIVYAIAGLSLGIGAVLWGAGRYIEASYKNKESNCENICIEGLSSVNITTCPLLANFFKHFITPTAIAGSIPHLIRPEPRPGAFRLRIRIYKISL